MLRNGLGAYTYAITTILNEVLSLNAQESLGHMSSPMLDIPQ